MRPRSLNVPESDQEVILLNVQKLKCDVIVLKQTDQTSAHAMGCVVTTAISQYQAACALLLH